MDISMDSMVNGQFSKNDPSRMEGNERIIPLTAVMLGRLLRKKENSIDGMFCSKIALVSRVDEVEPVGNRIQLTLNDSTGVVKIIKFKRPRDEELEMNTYYEFILSLKEEKDEMVVFCDKLRKVTSAQELMHHFLTVINAHIDRTIKRP